MGRAFTVDAKVKVDWATAPPCRGVAMPTEAEINVIDDLEQLRTVALR